MIRRSCLWIAFISLLVGACPRVEQPARPKNIPDSAMWAGGVDGGVWIDCSEVEPNGLYKCTVYHEYLETVIASGLYSLSAEGNSTEGGILDYKGFDGDVIYLTEDRRLVPQW